MATGIALFGSFLMASVAKAASSAWTIDSMLQSQTQHDGANCFNAVMVAKGYDDSIHHTDSSELRYFLEKTCQKRSSGVPNQQGDILIVLRQGTSEHAALAMDDDKVFEKLGIAGILGKFDDRVDSSVYRIKPINEAPYFADCDPSNCVVETYSCPNATVVKQELKVCLDQRDELGLNELDREFQRITFDTNKTVSLSPEGANALNQLVYSLSQLHGDEPCALYTDVAAFSIFANISNLNSESYVSGQSRIPVSQLLDALKSLRHRIQAHDKSDLTNAVLKEQGSWL